MLKMGIQRGRSRRKHRRCTCFTGPTPSPPTTGSLSVWGTLRMWRTENEAWEKPRLGAAGAGGW